MLERLIEELQKHEHKIYDLEDCKKYGCPNCNDFNTLSQKETLKSENLYVSSCLSCNHEFMALKVDNETKSLCTKHPYKEDANVVKCFVKELSEHVLFESKEVASNVLSMFHEIFGISKNISTLEKKYCVSKFQIKVDEENPSYLCLKFEYNAFKIIDFLNVLSVLVKENDNNITKETIQKTLDLKLSLLNLWKFEFVRKLEDMFSFNQIIEGILLFEQNKKIRTDTININLQNQCIFMGTILHICCCIEKYSKEEILKDQYKEQIIKALHQIYNYLSSSNFDFCEDTSKKAKLENIICLIQIMLVVDFE